MFDVQRMLVLRELHMRGSMAAVAEAMSFSSSAISQQIAQLEKEVGKPLIRRVGRGVQLTPEALVLVDAASQLADILERTEGELQRVHERVEGVVRVAAFQSAALSLLPNTLHEMSKLHPNVRIELVQKEPAEALRGAWSREFDIVIAEEYPGHSAPLQSGLKREPLLTDDIQLATPFESGITSLKGAESWPWVMEPEGTASRHYHQQLCRLAGFEPDIRFETADMQAHLQLVESGNAVALTPGILWSGRQVTCDVVGLEDQPKRTVFTAQRQSSLGAPAIQEFLKILRETAKSIS